MYSTALFYSNKLFPWILIRCCFQQVPITFDMFEEHGLVRKESAMCRVDPYLNSSMLLVYE